MKRTKKVMALLLGACMVMMSGVLVFAEDNGGRVLICEVQEHQHTEICAAPTLICTNEDHNGHTHDTACYEEKERTCPYYTREEWVELFGDDSDYQEEYNVEMDMVSGEYVEFQHVHRDDCYKTFEYDEPQCGEEEGDLHVESCYSGCSKEEHQHSEACYQQESSDNGYTGVVVPPAIIVPNVPAVDEPVIDEPEVPLAPLPDDEVIDENDVPLAPLPDDEFIGTGIVIDESDVPLTSAADVAGAENMDSPQTGDNAPLAALAGIALLAAGGIVIIGMRKKRAN